MMMPNLYKRNSRVEMVGCEMTGLCFVKITGLCDAIVLNLYEGNSIILKFGGM